MMRSPARSSSPARLEAAGHGLDHRLEARAGLARAGSVVLSLAVHEDARRRPARRVSTRGPNATARWKMLPARICSTSMSRSGGSASSSAGQSAAMERPSAPTSTATSLSTMHRVVVPVVLDEAVGREEAGERRVDPELLLGGRDVEADLPADRLGALGEDLAPPRQQGLGAASRCSRLHHDLERLAPVVDRVGLGGVLELHVVGHERSRVEHARRRASRARGPRGRSRSRARS